jgi:hypothetical protein
MTMRPDIPPAAPGTAGDTGDVTVVRVGTLDGWLSHTWDEGVQIDHLPDLHALRVETINSTYDVAIVSGARGEVLVRGGRYFPEWTSATFLGCSMGGGLLKRHGVHIGLRLEFYCGGRRIVTSPVCAIGRGEDARSA